MKNNMDCIGLYSNWISPKEISLSTFVQRNFFMFCNYLKHFFYLLFNRNKSNSWTLKKALDYFYVFILLYPRHVLYSYRYNNIIYPKFMFWTRKHA